jgi:hypothetical protein
MLLTQENTTQWDLRNINAPMRLGDKFFVLLLLAIVLVTAVKLFRIFRLSRSGKVDSTVIYRVAIARIADSLKQWLFVPLFVWGILASRHLYLLCTELLADKALHPMVLLYDFRQLATELYLAGVVSFVAFLARWYALKRLEGFHLDKN